MAHFLSRKGRDSVERQPEGELSLYIPPKVEMILIDHRRDGGKDFFRWVAPWGRGYDADTRIKPYEQFNLWLNETTEGDIVTVELARGVLGEGIQEQTIVVSYNISKGEFTKAKAGSMFYDRLSASEGDDQHYLPASSGVLGKGSMEIDIKREKQDMLEHDIELPPIMQAKFRRLMGRLLKTTSIEFAGPEGSMQIKDEVVAEAEAHLRRFVNGLHEHFGQGSGEKGGPTGQLPESKRIDHHK